MILTTKIKLEVSPQDVKTLEFMQGKCRGLYNWWIMKVHADADLQMPDVGERSSDHR